MKKNGTITIMFILFLGTFLSNTLSEEIGIIVEKDIYETLDDIYPSPNNPLTDYYIPELQKRYTVYLNHTDFQRGQNSRDDQRRLRTLLRNRYLNNGLTGAVLIGDLPYAKYEFDNPPYHDINPVDYYFMDIDKVNDDDWKDNNITLPWLADVFDGYEGDKIAEIWVSRIMAHDFEHDDFGEEVDIIAAYLGRVFDRMTIAEPAPRRAFIMGDFKGEVVGAYAEELAHTQDLNLPYYSFRFPYDTPVNYMREMKMGYEWSTIIEHADMFGIGFASYSMEYNNGFFKSSKYEAGGSDYILADMDGYPDHPEEDPKVRFFQLRGCQMSNFYAKGRNHTIWGLATAMLYDGLISFGGATPLAGHMEQDVYIDNLKNFKSFGEAFKDEINQSPYPWTHTHMILCGAGTLKFFREKDPVNKPRIIIDKIKVYRDKTGPYVPGDQLILSADATASNGELINDNNAILSWQLLDKTLQNNNVSYTLEGIKGHLYETSDAFGRFAQNIINLLIEKNGYYTDVKSIVLPQELPSPIGWSGWNYQFKNMDESKSEVIDDGTNNWKVHLYGRNAGFGSIPEDDALCWYHTRIELDKRYEITVRVESFHNTKPGFHAETGIIFEDDNNSFMGFKSYIYIGINENNEAVFRTRSEEIKTPGYNVGGWVKILKTDDTYTIFASNDGVAFTELFTRVITNSMPHVGFAYTSNDNSPPTDPNNPRYTVISDMDMRELPIEVVHDVGGTEYVSSLVEAVEIAGENDVINVPTGEFSIASGADATADNITINFAPGTKLSIAPTSNGIYLGPTGKIIGAENITLEPQVLLYNTPEPREPLPEDNIIGLFGNVVRALGVSTPGKTVYIGPGKLWNLAPIIEEGLIGTKDPSDPNNPDKNTIIYLGFGNGCGRCLFEGDHTPPQSYPDFIKNIKFISNDEMVISNNDIAGIWGSNGTIIEECIFENINTVDDPKLAMFNLGSGAEPLNAKVTFTNCTFKGWDIAIKVWEMMAEDMAPVFANTDFSDNTIDITFRDEPPNTTKSYCEVEANRLNRIKVGDIIYEGEQEIQDLIDGSCNPYYRGIISPRDPYYVDELASDFRLTRYSPLIDVGGGYEDIGAFSTDMIFTFSRFLDVDIEFGSGDRVTIEDGAITENTFGSAAIFRSMNLPNLRPVHRVIIKKNCLDNPSKSYLSVNNWDIIPELPDDYVLMDAKYNGVVCGTLTYSELPEPDEEACVNTSPDNIPPAEVSDVSTVETGSWVKITWSPNSEPDLLRYKVYRAPVNAPFNAVQIGSVEKPSTQFIDENGNLTDYEYKVIAYDYTGNQSYGIIPSTVIGNTDIFSQVSVSPCRRAMPFTMPEDGLIESITMYHNGGSGKMQLGIYERKCCHPTARLGLTAEVDVNSNAGWQTAYLLSPVSVSSGDSIWLAWVYEDNPGVRYQVGTPGRASSNDGWSNGMPSSFGCSTKEDYIYSIYATYKPNFEPPEPDNLKWAVFPYATSSSTISMAASIATDPNGVEYYFECLSSGGHGSGWQDSSTYIDNGLDPNTSYTYRVKARDKSSNHNETTWSSEKSSTTQTALSTVGNTQVFGYIATVTYRRAMPYIMPEDGIIKSISMYHEGGCGEMLFGLYDGENSPQNRLRNTEVTEVNSNAGWQAIDLIHPVFVSAGTKIWLAWVFENNPGFRYQVGSPGRAKATTGWSGGMPDPFGSSTTYNYIVSIYANYTPSSEDTNAPEPNPLTWATYPYALNSNTASMTATTAADISGVEYYFECTSGNCHNSGWIDIPSYIDNGLSPNSAYAYKVRVRDKSPNFNATSWSSEAFLTTPLQPIAYDDFASTNYCYEWISRVKISTLDNSSGASNYTDNTNITTNLYTDKTYFVTLTPGFTCCLYQEYWRIWIDFNQDGDFEDSGELVFQDNSMCTIEGTIFIPSSALSGSTRMRVAMSDQCYPPNPPEGTFTYGEVEDYTVNIE